MPNREQEERHLVEADRHIAMAEDNLRRIRERIEKLQAAGHSAEEHRALLSTMLNTLFIMKEHRSSILKTLAGLGESSAAKLNSPRPKE